VEKQEQKETFTFENEQVNGEATETAPDAAAPNADGAGAPAATQGTEENTTPPAVEVEPDWKVEVGKLKGELSRVNEHAQRLNGALGEERFKRKTLSEQLAALRQDPKEQTNSSLIDPEVAAVVKTLVSEQIRPLRDTIQARLRQDEENRQLFFSEKVTEATKRHENFEPIAAIGFERIQSDKELFRRWTGSTDPAQFMYDEGLREHKARNVDQFLAEAKTEGMKAGREALLKELQTKGALPASLSMVGSASHMQAKEGEDFRF